MGSGWEPAWAGVGGVEASRRWSQDESPGGRLSAGGEQCASCRVPCGDSRCSSCSLWLRRLPNLGSLKQPRLLKRSPNRCTGAQARPASQRPAILLQGLGPTVSALPCPEGACTSASQPLPPTSTPHLLPTSGLGRARSLPQCGQRSEECPWATCPAPPTNPIISSNFSEHRDTKRPRLLGTGKWRGKGIHSLGLFLSLHGALLPETDAY